MSQKNAPLERSGIKILVKKNVLKFKNVHHLKLLIIPIAHANALQHLLKVFLIRKYGITTVAN
jgi:hypothetical protein